LLFPHRAISAQVPYLTRIVSEGGGGQRVTGISAILLAAGESRRMGRLNKMTLPVAGVPLLRRTADTLLNSALGEIVVVLGHAQETARALLADLPLRLVSNEWYREGQTTSVYRGLEALSEPCNGVMVCLSDQPLLQVDDINRLVDAFMHRCPTSVLIPTWQGRRGNPVILAYEHRDAILAGGRNLGCRRFIDSNPQLVTRQEMDNDHVVFDLDTPEDYRRLLRRLGSGEVGARPNRAAAGR
jgi:molybdenum cofactor cytidylyltransferase